MVRVAAALQLGSEDTTRHDRSLELYRPVAIPFPLTFRGLTGSPRLRRLSHPVASLEPMLAGRSTTGADSPRLGERRAARSTQVHLGEPCVPRKDQCPSGKIA